MTVWGKDAESLSAALPQLEDAILYSESPPPSRSLILKEIA
jgi:hypothetical protein